MGQVEEVVRAAYAARMQADLAGMMACFSPDASFTLMGASHITPVPMCATGGDAIAAALDGLKDSFPFERLELVESVVQGSKGAFHWRIHVRAASTGKEAVTDILDLVEVRDGRIVSFRQFIDTALAAHLIQP